MAALIGNALDRLGAHAKVTGREQYAADLATGHELHAALVLCTTSRGRVRRLDTGRATRLAGVIGVLTHDNAPRLQPVDFLTLLQDATISHNFSLHFFVQEGISVAQLSQFAILSQSVDQVFCKNTALVSFRFP